MKHELVKLVVFLIWNCMVMGSNLGRSRELSLVIEFCVSGMFLETAWRMMNYYQATHPISMHYIILFSQTLHSILIFWKSFFYLAPFYSSISFFFNFTRAL